MFIHVVDITVMLIKNYINVVTLVRIKIGKKRLSLILIEKSLLFHTTKT